MKPHYENSARTTSTVFPAVSISIVMEKVNASALATGNQTMIHPPRSTIGRAVVTGWRIDGGKCVDRTTRCTTSGPTTPAPHYQEITDGVGEV